MSWTRNGDVWTLDTYPCEILRATEELPNRSSPSVFVIAIRGEYFVRPTLQAAQEFAEQWWMEWDARR